MAQKRMFDRAITDNERFADMPMSAKALYFLFGMEADDEGFVSTRRVMSYQGATPDDLKILLAKGYCIQFPTGIVVITDWNANNYLDKNRIKRTQYQEERQQLSLTNMGKYVFNPRLTSVVESRVEENRIEASKEAKPEEGKILSPSEQAAKLAKIRAQFPSKKM
jgi:hypothetical protein